MKLFPVQTIMVEHTAALQVFLVTGSSSGMGWYCAKTLAENGAHVIMAARSLERTQRAAEMIKVSHPSAALGSVLPYLSRRCFNACMHHSAIA